MIKSHFELGDNALIDFLLHAFCKVRVTRESSYNATIFLIPITNTEHLRSAYAL